MAIGIVVFPGSNCDKDCADAVEHYLQEKLVWIWHQEQAVNNLDAIILPGGFSYGDHLRAGAIARFAPAMNAVKDFAAKGGPLIGICNGFQILTESGLLPGMLRRNESLSFICDQVELVVENNRTAFTRSYQQGQQIRLPIAHAEGNYYADAETLKRLEDNHQVVFRYAENVNGAANQIAGICNEKGNVVGMMPHPERALDKTELMSGDGHWLFDSLKLALV